MIQIIEHKSSRVGPHLLVFGAIHGNEKCGTEALKKLKQDLDAGRLPLKCGALTMVPVCNPKAFEADKRFIEENLNRVIFRSDDPRNSYERQLAQQLCPLIEKCDYLLDLHSMEAKGTAFSMLNQFSPASVDFCLSLGASTLVEGWLEVFAAHPEVLSQCTQTYADRFKKPNALIECGSHRDPASVEVAYRAVLSALKFLDLADTESLHALGLPRTPPIPKRPLLKEVVFRKSMEDQFAKEWKNFEPLNAGEIIGRRSDGTEIVANFDSCIVFPNSKSPVGVEWFFLAIEK